MRKMKHFQDLGHRVIFLIGDFTGMIGDPTGKSKTRPPLTREQIEANAETYKKQAFKILDPEKTEVRFNSEWLGRAGLGGLHPAGRDSTTSRACSSGATSASATRPASRSACTSSSTRWRRPTTRSRSKADVELGGTDQLFNLNVGRDIMPGYGLEPQVVLTTPLLEGTGRRREDVEEPRQLRRRHRGAARHVREAHEHLGRAHVALLHAAHRPLAGRDRRPRRPRGRPMASKMALGRRIVADFHGSGGGRGRRGRVAARPPAAPGAERAAHGRASRPAATSRTSCWWRPGSRSRTARPCDCCASAPFVATGASLEAAADIPLAPARASCSRWGRPATCASPRRTAA